MSKVTIAATVMWADLRKPNDMSGKFQVELTNLSDKAVEALQGIGVEPRYSEDKADKGYHITCKSQRPITPVDPSGERIVEDVGNGSKAIAVIKPYEWTFKGKKGVSPSMMKLVITDLEEYEEVDDVDIDLEAAL